MTDHERLAPWVRLAALVALGIPQLLVGAWAIVDPQGWFDTFPGVDPRLVAAEPPFNRHLAADAGAGFLATGVGLVLAAWWDRRDAMVTALAVYLAFVVPHLVYHLRFPSPLLDSGEDVLNAVLLGAPVALAVGMLVVCLRGRSREPAVRTTG